MTNLNVSNSTIRALGTQQAKKLVNDILGSDGKVDKTDKDKLNELESLLKKAAEEGDGKVDGEESELIEALTDHNYILGVNAGTSEAYLSQNLKEIQKIQNTIEGEPTEVSFDGVNITTDGLFSDEVRVLRLRDKLPSDTSQESGASNTSTETNSTTQNSGGSSGVTQAQPTPGNPVSPIPQVNNYSPTLAPNAIPPAPVVSPENLTTLSAENQAYQNSVQALQNEVTNIRNLISDPVQVSEPQLRAGIQKLIENDPARAVKELARLNGLENDRQLLELMQQNGSISTKDIETIQRQLSNENAYTSLTDQSLENGQSPSDALKSYLKDNPLSEAQLNGYRSSLVATADNYLANPSPENQEAIKSELYDNLYVFEEGASPEQEAAYRRLPGALQSAEQNLEIVSQKNAILNGDESVLNKAGSSGVNSALKLAQTLAKSQSAPQKSVDEFTTQLNETLSYLKETPDQYPGQSADIARLETKLQALQSATSSQEKLSIINGLQTDLDELYIKSNVSQGDEGVDQARVLSQLQDLASSPDALPEVKQAVDFLSQYPELLSTAPKVADYKNILNTLNQSPNLSASQQNLKTALETGNVQEVNRLYLNDMLSGFAGLPFVGAAVSALNFTPLNNVMDNLQNAKLPGDWNTASSLGAVLEKATPERRAELMAALQSPDAQNVNQVLINDPEFANIVGIYSRAENAKSNVEKAYWGDNSTYGKVQDNLVGQENDPENIALELTQARTALEGLINDESADLSPVVRNELIAQKDTLTRAIALIEQGKFDEAAANDPTMKRLTSVLQAIDGNDSEPPLSMEMILKKQATLDTLETVSSPANMAKLEEALKDNPNYAHIFEKDKNGNYLFPDKLQSLINNKELQPDALALLLNQANRAVEVIHSAESREVDNLRANYEKGKGLHESEGGQRDFYSGYMALESLNTVAQTSVARAGLSQAQILNNIAQQQDVKSLLSNPDKAARRDALTDVMRSENIESGTTQARQDRLREYIEQVKDFGEKPSGAMLDNIFSSEEDTEGRQIIREQLAKLEPSVDISDIRSKEDLFRKLTPAQTKQFQDNIGLLEHGKERAKVELQRDMLMTKLEQTRPALPPGGPPYDSSVQMTADQQNIIEELNALNRTSPNVNTTVDVIKDIFADDETKALFEASQVLNDVSQDLKTDMGRALELLDRDIESTSAAAQAYLRGSDLPPRPDASSPDYANQVSTYVDAVQQKLQAYQATAPSTERGALDAVSQRVQQAMYLSDASTRVSTGNLTNVDQSAITNYTNALNFMTTVTNDVEETSTQSENFIENAQNIRRIDAAMPGASTRIAELLRGPITVANLEQFQTEFSALNDSDPELYQEILLRVQAKAYADTNFGFMTDAVNGRSQLGAGDQMAFGQIVTLGSSVVTDMNPRPNSATIFAWNELIAKHGASVAGGNFDRAAFLTEVANFQRDHELMSPALTQGLANFESNANQLPAFEKTVRRMPPELRADIENFSFESQNRVNASRSAIGVQGVSVPDAVEGVRNGNPPTDPDYQANLAQVTQQYENTSTAELAAGANATTVAVNDNLGQVYQEAERTGDYSLADRMRDNASRAYQEILQNQDEAFQGLSDTTGISYTPASNKYRAAAGISGSSQAAAGEQKAAELIAKANELADRLVLAPKGQDSEEFLNQLVSDFLNIIRDQDYKTRQLVLAQLANQMMTDSITNFYKDKTDKNNKYHQDALADMAASFERNIQQSIQSSLVASASGSDAQSVAAVSGQVGAAGTAQAMSVTQLRSDTEKMLSQAQQMEPPLITNQQKEQILNSLFDNNPNNDAMGILALAGLQSVN